MSSIKEPICPANNMNQNQSSPFKSQPSSNPTSDPRCNVPSTSRTTSASGPSSDLIISENHTLYTPRMFVQNSMLFRYLAHKSPNIVSLRRRVYNLHEVLLALKKIISDEKLFDPTNPTIVMCDELLEDALDIKAIAVADMRDQICKQFILFDDHTTTLRAQQMRTLGNMVTSNPQMAPSNPPTAPSNPPMAPSNPPMVLSNPPMAPSNPLMAPPNPPMVSSIPQNAPSNPTMAPSNPPMVPSNPPIAPSKSPMSLSIPLMGSSNPPMASSNPPIASSMNRASSSSLGRPVQLTSQPAAAQQLTASIQPSSVQKLTVAQQPTTVQPSGQALTLPSWAYLNGNLVIARMDTSPNFNIEGHYKALPEFLKVLHSVQGVEKSRTVFHYREITSLISQYIIANKNNLFDPRNTKVAIVKNDQLGKAFGVQAFARSQVTGLLRAQLIPYNSERDGPIIVASQNQGESQNKDSLKNQKSPADDASDDSDPPNEPSSSSRTGFNRKRLGLSITVMECSSGDETIYSAQGYETAPMCDENYTDSDESSNSGSSSNQYEYTEENIYRVEYEVDSGSEESDTNEKNQEKARESDEDSDIEDVTIAVTVAQLVHNMQDPDYSQGADYDSEQSDSDSSGFALTNSDPELSSSDAWKCLSCKLPNSPFMRYCHRCWEERKGWVAERRRPRRQPRRRKKSTNSVRTSPASKKSQFLTRTQSTPTYLSASKLPLIEIEPCTSASVGRISNPGVANSDMTEAETSDFLRSISQGSDSGFSQASAEILTIPDLPKASGSADKGTSDLSGTESGPNLMSGSLKRRHVLGLDFNNPHKKSKIDLDALNRKLELPPSMVSKETTSFLLTPDSDNGIGEPKKPSPVNPATLCTMCCVRPKDACFIHGQCSHQVCCYPCAKRIFKNRETCPVCRRRIEKITKNFTF